MMLWMERGRGIVSDMMDGVVLINLFYVIKSFNV